MSHPFIEDCHLFQVANCLCVCGSCVFGLSATAAQDLSLSYSVYQVIHWCIRDCARDCSLYLSRRVHLL